MTRELTVDIRTGCACTGGTNSVCVCIAGSTDTNITTSTVAHSVTHAAFYVSVDRTIDTAARSLERTESHHTVSHNTVNLFCMQSLCMHYMCMLVQNMCNEQTGIRMLMLLLLIWCIPGSNFSISLMVVSVNM